MPPLALTAQSGERLRRLGPDDRVGHEDDAEPSLLGAERAVHAENQIHVLADGLRIEPADLHQGVTAEHAEGPGDQEEPAESAPCRAAGDEGAHVLDHLQSREQVARRSRAGDPAVPDGAAVDDAHRSARGHRLLGPFDERAHGAHQGVLLQDRVGVGHAHQRVAGDVDPGIDGVGLAAPVLLADHDQVLDTPRDVHGADRARGQLQTDRRLRGHEVVRLVEASERLVRGAVVDHDDLELAVLEEAQRVDRVDDAGRLIEGRQDDGDGRRQRRPEHDVVAAERQPAHMLARAVERDRKEHRIHKLSAMK